MSKSLLIFKLLAFSLLLESFSCSAQVCVEEFNLHTDIASLEEKYHPSAENISRLDTVIPKVKVVRVSDGDTAEILYHDFYLSVRFDHIDAPEIRGGQAFSKASRKYLKKLIEGKEVFLVSQRKPNGGFGRILGTFYTEEGLNVNKAMLAKGYAWHYTEYSKDNSYAVLEKCAKENKIGLWKEPNPIAPWEWRKGKRE